MVDRKSRPIVPVEHTSEREHRRLLAERTNASLPKDGTEGMSAPLKLSSYAFADLPDATLWEGAAVYVSDLQAFAVSNGTAWTVVGASSGGRTKLVLGQWNMANTGDQVFTGVGFQPSQLLAFAATENTNGPASWGAYDGTNYVTLSQRQLDQYIRSDTSALLRLNVGATGETSATVSSLDADGFTIQWDIFAGSPSSDIIDLIFIAVE